MMIYVGKPPCLAKEKEEREEKEEKEEEDDIC